MNSVKGSLALLHSLVIETIRQVDKTTNGTATSFSGVKANLELLGLYLEKVRSLAEKDRECRIAVFGPPKRGKSTILNAILGANILPTGKTPKTHCVVEINNIAGTNKKASVRTYNADEELFFYDNVDTKDYIDFIEASFEAGNDVERVEVYGDFSAGLMPDNSVLIDTPGAEVGFEADMHADTIGQQRGEELSNDTRRAVKILDSVDIPLFCMRADQSGSDAEKRFYRKYMQRIRPINIINFKDKIDDAEDVFNNSVSSYGLVRQETVIVSAKDAADATFKGEKPSDESGFPELEELIKIRLNSMLPLECLKRSTSKYEAIIQKTNKETRRLYLPKAALYRYASSLNGFNGCADIKMMISALLEL